MPLKNIFCILAFCIPTFADANECVVLLHGLARTAFSMHKLEKALSQQNYNVINIHYPSRSDTIPELATMAVGAGLRQCQSAHAAPINFVTHSLGGILVRQYFQHNDAKIINRVVMLGPPNQGSEVVDHLKSMPGYLLLNGPAGSELGTDTQSVPNQLGAVNFELGVIAGTQSINLILSTLLPYPNDGKVSVANTKVKGMCAFVALPTSHPFMMRNNAVIGEVIHFLKNGKFSDNSVTPQSCRNSLIR